MRRVPAVLIVVLLLAGCSSTTETPATSTSPTATSSEMSPAASSPAPTPIPTPTAAPKPGTPVEALTAAATAIGCTGFAQATTAAPFADAWGECQLDGQRVQLYSFADDQAWAGFLDQVEAYGVTEAQMVHVGNIAAAPADQTKLDALRAALGG